jgi:flagella basal body P-ring formation protein FlgA
MTTAPITSVRLRLAVLLAALLLAAATLHARPSTPTGMPAREAIVQAVTARMGEGVTVEVVTLDLPEGAPQAFLEARPDPAARLGRAIRFTLIAGRGARVLATATLRVVADHVVTRRDLLRGMTVSADDVQIVRAEVQHVPVRRLPAGEQVIGSRVLRPVAANVVLLPCAVVLRRAVEPGDRITAVAISGDVRVSAELTATDGGEPGDVIRVVNTDTRRSLRGRVIGEGLVEVGYAR